MVPEVKLTYCYSEEFLKPPGMSGLVLDLRLYNTQAVSGPQKPKQQGHTTRYRLSQVAQRAALSRPRQQFLFCYKLFVCLCHLPPALVQAHIFSHY